MIEIEIPKDIKDYEPKLIGPFTTRQAICTGAIVIISIVGYNVLKHVFDNGLKFIIPLIVCLIPMLIGWYKPYGMRFEQYALSQFNTVILPPKKRLYKVENTYQQFEKLIEKEEKEKLEAEKKKAKQQTTQQSKSAPKKNKSKGGLG